MFLLMNVVFTWASYLAACLCLHESNNLLLAWLFIDSCRIISFRQMLWTFLANFAKANKRTDERTNKQTTEELVQLLGLSVYLFRTQNPSILPLSISLIFQGRREVGANPVWHWTRSRIHPGEVVDLSQH